MNYIFRVLRGASFKKLFTVIDRIHEKSGQNKFYTLLDIINCAIRYGAGYHDYLIFAFWAMNHRQRNSYLTRMRNKRLNTLLHDERYTYIFDKKQEFDKNFADYIGRDFRAVAGLSYLEFVSFMADKEAVFAKPTTGESGKGIEKLTKSKFEDLRQMYDYITDPAHRFGVIEEQLQQHPDLTAVYPHSINSYRIVTLLADDGQVHCVYAVAKFGNAGKVVDNMENDGLCCPIDQSTGKICGCAHTSALINYDAHPYTGVELIGYQLPYVKEAVEMAKEAALVVPQIRYIGWDVCVTPNGPAIIEGNTYPGYDFWQLPEHTPDKIGLYPYFRNMVRDYK